MKVPQQHFGEASDSRPFRLAKSCIASRIVTGSLATGRRRNDPIANYFGAFKVEHLCAIWPAIPVSKANLLNLSIFGHDANERRWFDGRTGTAKAQLTFVLNPFTGEQGRPVGKKRNRSKHERRDCLYSLSFHSLDAFKCAERPA
jgi:hypothetical protein